MDSWGMTLYTMESAELLIETFERWKDVLKQFPPEEQVSREDYWFDMQKGICINM